MHTTDQLTAALHGRYRIERLIGEGGMATVYLALDVRHNRKVALKVLKPDLGAVIGVERFLSEIKVTANLQHPNLLPLFDSGAASDLLFYVMPFVDGESLREKLRRERQLRIEDALRITTAVASALDYAHRHGVIHRDLKPENILLHDGQPLVSDFGIALALSNAGGNRITQTGLSVGTPQYMSPEQATGDRAIDARSDIYSLGAVAYEMLTGEPPHAAATSQAIIARVLTEKPRPIRATRPSVPPQVEAAIEHGLEKLAADRFSTAQEFAEALTGARPFVAPATTPAHDDSAVRGRRSVRVREIVAWSLAAVGTGAAAWMMFRASAPPLPAAPAEFVVEMPESVSVRRAPTLATIALSEDGSTMVFQGMRGDSTALYLRRLNDRTVHRIRGTEGGSRPALSPDGSELLFQLGSTINRISVLGGTPRPIAEAAGGGSPSWGANHQIIYPIGRKLFIGSDQGEAPRVLASPDSSRNHVSYAWPHILPGGKAALIVIRVGANELDSARLGVVSLPDGRITEFTPTIKGSNPHYSTGHLYYVDLGGTLFAVPFSLDALRVTDAPVVIAENVWLGFGGGASFAVARGGMVALQQWSTDPTSSRELVVVSRTGMATPVGIPPNHYQSPRVSPDGRQVALAVFTANFGANQIGGNPDIWRLDLGSKILTRVTTDSVSFRPEWSADGERIAYVSLGDSLVRWRPVNSTAPPTPVVRSSLVISTFTLGKVHGHVAMSASNNAVSVLNDIFVSPIDSLVPPRPFEAERYIESTPRLSPDERVIAYVTNRTGRNEVYVRAFLTDGPEVQISNSGGSEPIWSRDGRELFYRVPGYMMSARFADGARVAVAKRDTLFRDTFLLSQASVNYDVFPDGKSFVMLRAANAQANSNLPLVVITNWSDGGRKAR